MKCENCGTELIGAAIVCRQCNHNVAQGRVGQWRAQRNYQSSGAQSSSATGISSSRANSPSPAIAPKPEIKRLPAEPFPVTPKRPPSASFEPKQQVLPAAITKSAPAQPAAVPASSENDPGVIQFPAWRSQLKDKVKEVRDRRGSGSLETDSQPDEAQLDPNPIVESALKRIRWSQHIPPAQLPAEPKVQELKPETEAKEAKPEVRPEVKPEVRIDTNPFQRVEPKADSRPLTRPATSATNPLLARKPVPKTDSAPLSVPIQATTHEIETAPVESRVELDPVTPPASVPGSSGQSAHSSGRLDKPGSGSLPALPKVRTTGEMRKSDSTQQSPLLRTPSGSLAQPPSKPVETQVIGLAPSVSDLTANAPGTTASLKPRQATLWTRTLAGTCDFEVVAMAFLAVFWPYAVLNTSVGYESATVLFVLLASLMFCYQLLTLTIANRTTGMAFLRLRLVNAANKQKAVTFSQKFWRSVAATVVAFCPPLNFLVMQSNPQHRSLPDLISGTMLLERVKSN
ncbi:MAG: RDD family protein [Blastocatellia bacterium]